MTFEGYNTLRLKRSSIFSLRSIKYLLQLKQIVYINQYRQAIDNFLNIIKNL
jgi:hypothetical protein